MVERKYNFLEKDREGEWREIQNLFNFHTKFKPLLTI